MWRTLLVCLALVFVVTGVAAAQQAPNGEAIYKQHCADCHEGSLPRLPTRAALRAMAPEAIDTALSSFSMRRQGAALTAAERRAVSAFLAGRPAGSYRAPLEMIGKEAYCAAGAPAAGAAPRDALAGAAWNGWGVDAQNSRSQTAAAAGLAASDVPKLKLKWAFGIPGVSASGSQVTVVGSRAFVGSRNGMVYALDTKTGCLAWAFEADAGVRSTPVVGRAADGSSTLYFGDAHAQVYALDATTGQRRWKVKVDDHLDAMVTAAVAFHNGRIYVGVSSLEEGTAGIPTYECCTFRGSVLALDAATGRQIWKTYTIPREPQRTTKSANGTQLWGPSGVGVWSQPAIDAERNRLYVTTGDSYSNPPAPESDAIMALAMDTGRVLWIRQTLAGDAWNVGCLNPEPGRVNCPEKAGPDFDFGSSPAIATLPGGQRILVAGQKSGALYGINPDTGEQLWKTQAGAGGILGGIEWGFAVEGATALCVAVERARERARTSWRSRRGECRRWQTGLDDSTDSGHVREAARVQHRSARCGVVHSRGRVFRQSRWTPACVRQQVRESALGHQHRQRVRHGESRPRPWGIHERSWRNDRRRHGLRQLGLRLAGLHAWQRRPCLFNRRQVRAKVKRQGNYAFDKPSALSRLLP